MTAILNRGCQKKKEKKEEKIISHGINLDEKKIVTQIKNSEVKKNAN